MDEEVKASSISILQCFLEMFFAGRQSREGAREEFL